MGSSVSGWCPEWITQGRVVATVATLALGGVIYHITQIRKQGKRPKKDYPKNVVILHQFARPKLLPNISPFALKLETYLRITKTPYECDFERPMGPKAKCPWITYNGVEVADSEFIIAYLNIELNLDLNASLTPIEKAHSRAYQVMADEHLVWIMAVQRYVNEPTGQIYKQFPQLLNMAIGQSWLPLPESYKLKKVQSIFKKYLYASIGMSRYSEEEVYILGKRDLKAVSELLGDKKYFFGDQPTELDCCIFAGLCQFIWGSIGTQWPQILSREFPNLQAYVLRIKEKSFPDWDQLTAK